MVSLHLAFLWASLFTLTVWNPLFTFAVTSSGFATRALQSMKCKNNNECDKTRKLACNDSAGHCTCMEGYSPSNTTSCGKNLGDPCDKTCDASNSQCSLVGKDHLCTCEDGLTASSDGTFCYGRPMMYRDVCDHDENCTDIGEHIKCKQFSCVCKENYIRWDAVCKEKIDRLGASCNATTQMCYTEVEKDSPMKRKCLEGVCKCDYLNGYVPQDGICKKRISLLGAPCNASIHVCYLEDERDNQTLHCKNGICQCKDAFLLDDGKCKKKIDILGEKCSLDTDVCHVKNERYLQDTECANGTCQCNSAFVKESGICKQKISLLGAPCNTISHVCYFEEDGDNQKIQCKDGVCQCKAEFALKEKKCQKVKASNSGMLIIGPSAWILLFMMSVINST